LILRLMQNGCDDECIAQTKDRAATYALFSRLLRQEISADALRRLRKMREGAGDSEPAGEGLLLLDRYLKETGSLEEQHVLDELSADYAGLFLNAGDRPAHPYESVYTSPERLLMQQAQKQVRQIYAESGLILSSGEEPEDHIALEMEYMGHLCSRTASASEEGDLETVRAHLTSQREFLSEHLLRWAPQFAEDLKRFATTDFYRALGCLIRDFLQIEKKLCDLPAFAQKAIQRTGRG
jgi:putative dimethyl sulfoxide reductase chaperone